MYGVLFGRGALITLLMLGATAAPVQAATVDVSVGNNAFTPADVTITQGDAVTWTFAGPDTNHSVTTTADQSEHWDSDPNKPNPNHQVGDKFSWSFQKPGEFSYFCKVHANMTGTIVVQPKINDPNPPQDIVAPRLGSLRVSVKRRRAKVTLTEDAKITARLRGPTRRTLRAAGKAGPNVLRLPSKLRPGRYALTLRATDSAGNRSAAARVKFRVRAR